MLYILIILYIYYNIQKALCKVANRTKVYEKVLIFTKNLQMEQQPLFFLPIGTETTAEEQRLDASERGRKEREQDGKGGKRLLFRKKLQKKGEISEKEANFFQKTLDKNRFLRL